MDCWFVGLLLCTLVLGATRSLGYQPRGGIQDFLVNSGSILGHPGSNFINFGSFFVVCVCVCVLHVRVGLGLCLCMYESVCKD